MSNPLSRDIFVAKIGGDVFVFGEEDENILAGAMRFAAFQQFHAGRKIGTNPVAATWLKSPERRTYGSLVFDPSGDCAEGNYNTWCGLAVDGRPGQCGKIVAHKVLITNRTIGYEAKGKDAITAPNYAHVIILTNNDWAVQTGADARRWMVLDMSEMRMGDHDYFLELSDERDNGGTAAFLDYLMKVDLSGFNPRALPKTEGLQAQRAETFGRTNPVAAFLMRVLSEGSFWSKAELCRGRSLPAARAERGTGAL